MTNTMSDDDKRKKLEELMRHFDTAMLVTQSLQGGLRSRPLAVAEKGQDGSLSFATAIESPKVFELEDDPRVNVVMQDRKRFVSVTGRARISRERALIDRLWSESWRIWFPQGKADPSLALILVEPEEATYWDTSGEEGFKYLFQAAKAYVTGTKPDSDGDENRTAHVKL
jgi:general stress protein 26